MSNGEYAAFVDDGGYRRPELWDAEGWQWRSAAGLDHPVYWRRTGSDGWEHRRFDRWEALPPNAAVIHVSWYEARAYCRWAGRRLPTEVEWEVAAAGEPNADGTALATHKRRYPWGDAAPDPTRANLDGSALGTIPVGALPAGDSAFGCRQMIGNVWEWTDTRLRPLPGLHPGHVPGLLPAPVRLHPGPARRLPGRPAAGSSATPGATTTGRSATTCSRAFGPAPCEPRPTDHEPPGDSTSRTCTRPPPSWRRRCSPACGAGRATSRPSSSTTPAARSSSTPSPRPRSITRPAPRSRSSRPTPPTSRPGWAPAASWWSPAAAVA